MYAAQWMFYCFFAIFILIIFKVKAMQWLEEVRLQANMRGQLLNNQQNILHPVNSIRRQRATFNGHNIEANIIVNSIAEPIALPNLSANHILRPPQNRQGNIFTITDESGATRNYADFFVVEPNSDDPRVRAQLEKDDKDLPTYEEVMAATLAASAASYAADNRADFDSLTSRVANGSSSVDISSPSSTRIPIEVPPYSEVDPNPLPPIAASNQNTETTITLPTIGSTSTSFALQISNSNTNSADTSSSTSQSAVRTVTGNTANESQMV